MAKPDMIVTFRNVGRECAWTALRLPRTIVPGPPAGSTVTIATVTRDRAAPRA